MQEERCATMSPYLLILYEFFKPIFFNKALLPKKFFKIVLKTPPNFQLEDVNEEDRELQSK
jgi:hypothetical protein